MVQVGEERAIGISSGDLELLELTLSEPVIGLPSIVYCFHWLKLKLVIAYKIDGNGIYGQLSD